MNEQFTAEIPVEQFDLSLLPPSARNVGTPPFRDAVVAFFQAELKKSTDWIQVVVDDKFIRVVWRSKGGDFDPVEHAIDRLKTGDYRHGVQVLRIVSKVRPNDVTVNFNLGMALSDLGSLDDAIEHLGRAVKAEPNQANLLVALGVAYYRKRDLAAARKFLEQALALDGDNPYVLRNLGGCLLALGEPPQKPIQFLKKAATLLPDDQQAWIGLGQALEQQKDLEEADKAYLRAIDVNPHNQFAEVAKTGRSRIAQANMRENVGGGIRMDAVMYCLGALERCENLSPAEVQKIAMEIAAVGTKGINPNDANRKHTLRSLPGEFTGLHLLCYMYVTWKQVAPHMSIGFDLDREYQEALKLRDLRKSKD